MSSDINAIIRCVEPEPDPDALIKAALAQDATDADRQRAEDGIVGRTARQHRWHNPRAALSLLERDALERNDPGLPLNTEPGAAGGGAGAPLLGEAGSTDAGAGTAAALSSWHPRPT